MLRFSQLMSDFANRVGISKPDVDERNHYHFTVDGMSVACFEINSLVYLQADLGLLPSKSNELLDKLKFALKLALSNTDSSMSSLSITNENELILFDCFSISNFNVESFEQWFGDFLDCQEMFLKALGDDVNPVLGIQTNSDNEQIFIG